MQACLRLILRKNGSYGKGDLGYLHLSKDCRLTCELCRSGKMEEFELIWQRSQRPTEADLSSFLTADTDCYC